MLSRIFSKLAPSIPDGQRIYAIGDVHGRLDLLDELLGVLVADNASRSVASVQIVMLGDLIDRGPNSRQVISRIRRGVDWARVVALKGNHEAVMLRVLAGEHRTLEAWLTFGGRDTLESWGISQIFLDGHSLDEILAATRAVVSTDEQEWLAAMPQSLHVGDYYFVHAGVRPHVPLDKQSEDDALWIRDEFLNSRSYHGAVVVHGHTITHQVEQRSNRIAIDTGAYAGGCLSAIGLEGSYRWIIQVGRSALP